MTRWPNGWPRPSSPRANCMTASSWKCCAPPTARPTRWPRTRPSAPRAGPGRALRSHSASHRQRFGPNTGADIPVTVEFTRNLQPLLERFGHDPRLTLILFTLDETTYSRELAPLAGFYPALRLGPPWWFFDSWNGMAPYFDQGEETAGLDNTAGFKHHTRAFPSIPARHHPWARAGGNWPTRLL